MHGLYLNEHGAGKLVLNFLKRIRSILNSESAKQKLTEVYSKISTFWRSRNNPKSDKPETIYALSHNLKQETSKCKKDPVFSTSKNFSAKENTNIKDKSKNESGIHNKSQKCENFIDSLFNIRKYYCNKINLAHININSIRNNIDILTNSVTETWRH